MNILRIRHRMGAQGCWARMRVFVSVFQAPLGVSSLVRILEQAGDVPRAPRGRNANLLVRGLLSVH